MIKIIVAAVVCVVGITAVGVSNPPYAVAPAPTVVPVYSAVHGQNQSNDELLAELKKITAELVKLNAKLGSTEPQPSVDPLAIARASCLGCHSPKDSEAKGFSFTLFTDNSGTAFAPLNGRDRLRVSNRISDGTMPKGSKMSDSERKALAEHFRKKVEP